MRMRLLALAIAGAALLPACIQDATVIKLKPDGSGTIEKTTTMTQEMFAQLQEMQKGMGGEPEPGKEAPKPKDPFSEDEAKANAAKMGEGVTFVSYEKVDANGHVGSKAIYAFTDVTKLVLNESPSSPQGEGGGGGDEKKKDPIKFQFAKGGASSTLTVVFPEMKPKEEPAKPPDPSEPPPPPENPQEDAQKMEQAKMIFKDMRVSIIVEAQGTIVKTNSTYVDGPRVTLLEMDFGQLLENMDKFKEVSKANPKTMEEMKAMLKDVKGFKINPTQQVTIEFK